MSNRTITQHTSLVTARLKHWPKAAEILKEVKEDILAYKTFPEKHYRSIHSVNSLERLNRDIRQRTQVVGVFRDRSSVYRLVGTMLVNMDEDWRAGRRYMGKEGIEMKIRGLEWKNKEFIFEDALI